MPHHHHHQQIQQNQYIIFNLINKTNNHICNCIKIINNILQNDYFS